MYSRINLPGTFQDGCPDCSRNGSWSRSTIISYEIWHYQYIKGCHLSCSTVICKIIESNNISVQYGHTVKTFCRHLKDNKLLEDARIRGSFKWDLFHFDILDNCERKVVMKCLFSFHLFLIQLLHLFNNFFCKHLGK